MEKLAEETRRIVRLQAVELERTRLTSALKALPAEVAEAEKQLASAQKHVANTEAGLKREELKRGALQLEAGSQRSKAARFRGQMDAARNAAQAQALEHEIHFAEAEVTRLEDEELASMETSERLEAELAQARHLAAKLTETVGLIRARVAEQDLEFREQLTALKTERDRLRSELAPWDDGARLAHFDRIAGSRGTGLARAMGQQCTGCRMGIRPQVWNQLRDGVVLPCESCSRILYFDPSMEPEPAKAPVKIAQSVGANVGADAPREALGGSSIRNRQAGA